MIEEFAVVTKRLDDHVMLEIERRTACGFCGQKRGCGNATWGKLLGHASQEFPAQTTIDVNVGDSVVVGIDEQVILTSVVYLYVIPLVTMLIGAVLADILLNGEIYVLLASVAGLILGLAWVKGHLAGFGQIKKPYANKFRATVLRRAESAASCNNSK